MNGLESFEASIEIKASSGKNAQQIANMLKKLVTIFNEKELLKLSVVVKKNPKKAKQLTKFI